MIYAHRVMLIAPSLFVYKCMQNAFLIKPIDCLSTKILFKSVKSFYAINVLDNQKVSGNIFKVYSKKFGVSNYRF